MADKNASVMEMMLQKKEQERKEIQHEHEILQRKIQQLESAYSLCQETKDDLAKDLFQAEDKIDQLKDLLNQGRNSESLEEFKDKYYTLEKRFSDLLEQTKDDEETNNELIEQLREAQKLSLGKEKVINDLNQQLTKSGTHSNTLQKESKRLHELLKENEDVITNLTNGKIALEKKISDVVRQADTLHAQLNIEVSERNNEGNAIDKIREQTISLIEDKKKSSEEVKHLKKELANARTEVEESRQVIEVLKEEYEKCSNIIEGEKYRSR